MAALLGNWLANTIELENKLTNLESELSNGYLLGKLLNSLGLESEFQKYQLESTTFAKIHNYELLFVSLNKMNVHFDVKRAKCLMTESPGAATQLLFDIKQTLEQKKGSRKKDSSLKAIQTVRPPKNGRHVEQANVEPSKRFVHDTIRTVKEEDQKSYNKMSMIIHLRNFKNAMWANEEAADKMQQQSALEQRNEQSRRKQELSMSFRKSRELTSKAAMQSTISWKKNKDVENKREATELKFELSMRERRSVKKNIERKELASELDRELQSFDRNMQRLGINNDGLADLDKVVGTGLEHFEKLKSKVDSLNLNPRDNAEFLASLTRKKSSSSTAAKDREQRRIKQTLDQEATSKETNKKVEHDIMLQRLLDEGQARRVKHFRSWSHRREKHRRNIRHTKTIANKKTQHSQLAEREVADSLSALRTEPLARSASKRMLHHETKQNRIKIASFKQDNVRSMCKSIANKIVDFVLCFLQERDTLLGAPIPVAIFRALKQKFVSNTPLFEYEALDESVTKLSFDCEVMASTLMVECKHARGEFTNELSGIHVDRCSKVEMILEACKEVVNKLDNGLPCLPFSTCKRPLLLCILENCATNIAETLSGNFGLKLCTFDTVSEELVLMSKEKSNVQNDTELSYIEKHAIEIGDKLVKLQGKKGGVSDELKATAIAIYYQLSVERSQIGLVLCGFPQTEKQSQCLEREIISLIQDDEIRQRRLAVLEKIISGSRDEADEYSCVVDSMFILETDNEALSEMREQKWLGNLDNYSEENKDELFSKFQETCKNDAASWKNDIASLQSWHAKLGNYHSFEKDVKVNSKLLEDLRLSIELVDHKKAECQKALIQGDESFNMMLCAYRVEKRNQLSRGEKLLHLYKSGEGKLDIRVISSLLEQYDMEIEKLNRNLQFQFSNLYEVDHSTAIRHSEIMHAVKENLWNSVDQQVSVDKSITLILNAANEVKRNGVLNDLEVSLGNISDDKKVKTEQYLQNIQADSTDSIHPDTAIGRYYASLGTILRARNALRIRQQKFIWSYFHTVEPTILAQPKSLQCDAFKRLIAFEERNSCDQSKEFVKEVKSLLGKATEFAEDKSISKNAELTEFPMQVLTEADDAFSDFCLLLLQYVVRVAPKVSLAYEDRLKLVDDCIGEYLYLDYQNINYVLSSIRNQLEKGHLKLGSISWQKAPSTSKILLDHFNLREATLSLRQLSLFVDKFCALKSKRGHVSYENAITGILELSNNHEFPSFWSASDSIRSLLSKFITPSSESSKQHINYTCLLTTLLVHCNQPEIPLESLLAMKKAARNICQDENDYLFSRGDFMSIFPTRANETTILLRDMYYRSLSSSDGKANFQHYLFYLSMHTQLLKPCTLGFARAYTICTTSIQASICNEDLISLLTFAGNLCSTRFNATKEVGEQTTEAFSKVIENCIASLPAPYYTFEELLTQLPITIIESYNIQDLSTYLIY